LGEEYAKDYQVAHLGHDTEDSVKRNKEQEELHEMFISVCQKLDALSNFHYTPKPPKATATVTSSAPAINMEEVTPLATSTASQAMPEQVFKAEKGRSAPMGKAAGK
jgi:U3 small nucleolar RNA-associated protein MPP10